VSPKIAQIAVPTIGQTMGYCCLDCHCLDNQVTDQTKEASLVNFPEITMAPRLARPTDLMIMAAALTETPCGQAG
jgi:hypothetical protein